MADEKRLTTKVDTPVAERLFTHSALTGIPVKKIVNAILNAALPSAGELARRLCESEATS